MSFSIPDKATLVQSFEQASGVSVTTIQIFLISLTVILCIGWAAWVIAGINEDEDMPEGKKFGRVVMVILIATVFILAMTFF